MLLFLALLPNATAADVFVASPGELVAAINASPTSGSPEDYRVWMLPGTYLTDDLHFHSRKLEIHALVPGSVTLERGSGDRIGHFGDSTIVRLFDLNFDANTKNAFTTSETADVVVERGYFVSSGNTWDGRGGMITATSSGPLKIRTSYFGASTAAGPGGHILASGGSVVIEDSLFEDGISIGHGGSIKANISSLTVRRVTFRGNYGGDKGGALFLSGGSAILEDVVFHGNTASFLGGAVFSSNSLSIDRGLFCLNEAEQRSVGGLYWTPSGDKDLVVNNSVFLNNGSTVDGRSGSAMRVWESSPPNSIEVRNSTFSRNVAGGASIGHFDFGLPSSLLFEDNLFAYSNGPGSDLVLIRGGIGTLRNNVSWPASLQSTGFVEYGGGGADPGFSAPPSDTCDVGLVATTGDVGAFGGQGFIDLDGDGFFSPTDCDDTDFEVRPGVPDDDCDGIDDDCDFLIDEDAALSEYFLDADGDGFGDPSTPVQSCGLREFLVENADDCDDADPLGVPLNAYVDADGDGDGAGDAIEVCGTLPTGFSFTPIDCDDSDSSRYSGAIEICDGIDNNCDGNVDEALLFVEYSRDQDGDGFGDAFSEHIFSCGPVDGWVSDVTDCDDADVSIHPGVVDDLCDGVDRDCDGEPDQDAPMLPVFPDGDGDGFGQEGPSTNLRCPDVGWSSRAGDCDDAIVTVNPDSVELCDGIDNNCDGLIDGEDPSTIIGRWYEDVDGDGFGAGPEVMSCSPPEGWVVNDADCGVFDPAIHPGAPDTTCDGVDDNCDGTPDEGAPMVEVPLDVDGDGVAGEQSIFARCPVRLLETGDCNDTDPTIHPGAEELCDGIDSDCDGVLDDGDCPVATLPPEPRGEPVNLGLSCSTSGSDPMMLLFPFLFLFTRHRARRDHRHGS